MHYYEKGIILSNRTLFFCLLARSTLLTQCVTMVTEDDKGGHFPDLTEDLGFFEVQTSLLAKHHY